MKSCNDCIHFPICYKIEHYGRDTYSADPCEMYMGKADTKPLVHGRWVYGCQCSACGDRHGPYNDRHKPYYNFCPNCGAIMDIDEEGET